MYSSETRHAGSDFKEEGSAGQCVAGPALRLCLHPDAAPQVDTGAAHPCSDFPLQPLPCTLYCKRFQRACPLDPECCLQSQPLFHASQQAVGTPTLDFLTPNSSLWFPPSSGFQ